MVLPIFQVDAFSPQVFGGNPAAVIILDRSIPDQMMQHIAAENNLSETAYVLKQDDQYHIRWFTPRAEVALCGHATLASAKVLFDEYGYEGDTISFTTETKGVLEVSRLSGGRISLDFPSQEVQKYVGDESFLDAFNDSPQELYHAGEDIMLVFESQKQVAALQVDLSQLKKIEVRGFIATAKGDEEDFISRFFAPAVGVDEDPVTGSAHTKLIPYWAKRLSKNKLVAKQISEREGRLWCEDKAERVLISGFATLYMKGKITV